MKKFIISGRLIRILVILNGLMRSGSSLAQGVSQPEIANSLTLRLESYGVERGLSQGMIWEGDQDHQGYLWLATKEGLNRFDGYSFRNFRHDSKNPGSISDNLNEWVYADSKGRIWATSTGKGLELFIPETESFWHFQQDAASDNGITSSFFRQIVQDDKGNLFFQKQNESGFDVLPAENKNGSNPERFRFIPITSLYPGLKSVYQRGPKETSSKIYFHTLRDELWVEFGDSLYCLGTEAKSGRAPVLAFAKGPGPQVIQYAYNKIIQDPASQDFYQYQKGVLLKYDPVSKNFFYFISIPENLRNHPNPFIDSQHRLWFQQEDKSFLRLNLLDKSFQVIHLFTSSGNKIPELILVEEDWNHNLWFGSPGFGLFKLSASAERFVPEHAPDADNFPLQAWNYRISMPGFEKVYDENLRHEWAALAREMMKKNPGFQFQNLPFQIARDPEGIYYATGYFGHPDNLDGLYSFDPQRREMKLICETPTGHSTWFANPVFTDTKGGVWFGSDIVNDTAWLYQWEGEKQPLKKWSFPVKASLRGYRFIIDMLEDPDGTLWIATAQGLFSFQPPNGNWNHFQHQEENKNGLPVNTILCLTKDPMNPERFIWLGTNGGGLCKLDKSTGSFTDYSTEAGLPNNVVYGAEFDFRNNLWLSTNKGICLFDPNKLTTRNFTTADGLTELEFNSFCSSHSREGEIWFGGIGGELHFNPANFYKEGTASSLIIHQLKINNKPVLLSGNSGHAENDFSLERPLELTKSITLTHEETMITIGFALMDLTHPENNRFKYQLEGFNEEWIDAGNLNEATFTNLEPGNYVFKVMGCNSDGIWTESPAQLEIIVLPPWWRTLWFRALVLLLVGTGIYLFLRYRFKKAMELQMLRARIARDLHDEIGSTLSSISIYSLAMKKSAKDLPPEAGAILDKIRESTTGTMESMNDIVWTIDAKNDSFEKSIDRMRGFAVSMTENAGIRLSFEAEDEGRKLEMVQRKNVYLIFKEAVNNAVKYSQCSLLSIRIFFKSRILILEIQDDGKGFDSEILKNANNNPGGNGLQNMKFRAEECGGILFIDSKPGKGSLVRLELPL